jgi:hypothetical protein
MGWTCSTNAINKFIQNFGWKTWTKRLLRRSEHRWVDTRTDLREGWEDVEWMHLVQGRYQQWAVVDKVMNLQVPWKIGNFLTSWVTVSFSRILLHGVSYLMLLGLCTLITLKVFLIWQISDKYPKGSSVFQCLYITIRIVNDAIARKSEYTLLYYSGNWLYENDIRL